MPGTRTVTKWNGRKNEWKTIKEGPRREGERRDRKRWKEEERMSGEREKERKVDHLARPDKVHYFL